MKKSYTVFWVLGLLAVLGAGGCVPAIPFTTGEALREEGVAAITPGTTTKRQLFERLGAPSAILGSDEVAVMASPVTWTSIYENRTFYTFKSDTFFGLFPKGLDEYRRIYYYEHVKSGKIGFILVLGLYESGYTDTDRLWILMNEKTGIVEDYAFKKHDRRLVYGGKRGVSLLTIFPRK